MAILQALDGKFYDVPDDQVGHYEVPREKVKELLEKSGNLPATQGRPGPSGGPSGGPMGGPITSGGPVVIQIFPSGAGGPSGYAPQGAPSAEQPEGGDVHPYWWWRNMSYGPWWRNVWSNW